MTTDKRALLVSAHQGAKEARTDRFRAVRERNAAQRALAESRAECERLMTIAGWGGLAADAPERLILASEMFDGIACCDKWQAVYRVGDDGQPMPESATAYVRADVADRHKARAERLAGALRPFVGATLTHTGQVIGLMREDFDNARAALTDQETT